MMIIIIIIKRKWFFGKLLCIYHSQFIYCILCLNYRCPRSTIDIDANDKLMNVPSKRRRRTYRLSSINEDDDDNDDQQVIDQ
jgi:hypothetical protein